MDPDRDLAFPAAVQLESDGFASNGADSSSDIHHQQHPRARSSTPEHQLAYTDAPAPLLSGTPSPPPTPAAVVPPPTPAAVAPPPTPVSRVMGKPALRPDRGLTSVSNDALYAYDRDVATGEFVCHECPWSNADISRVSRHVKQAHPAQAFESYFHTFTRGPATAYFCPYTQCFHATTKTFRGQKAMVEHVCLHKSGVWCPHCHLTFPASALHTDVCEHKWCSPPCLR